MGSSGNIVRRSLLITTVNTDTTGLLTPTMNKTFQKTKKGVPQAQSGAARSQRIRRFLNFEPTPNPQTSRTHMCPRRVHQISKAARNLPEIARFWRQRRCCPKSARDIFLLFALNYQRLRRFTNNDNAVCSTWEADVLPLNYIRRRAQISGSSSSDPT